MNSELVTANSQRLGEYMQSKPINKPFLCYFFKETFI